MIDVPTVTAPGSLSGSPCRGAGGRRPGRVLLTWGFAMLISVAAAAGPADLLVGCPDPAIIPTADGRAFVIFCTGPGAPIWRSTDLHSWQRIGRVFDDNAPAWTRKMVDRPEGIWAPDIARFNGRYHLYYSVSSFGSQRSVIGLAVNPTLDPASPSYRWEDLGPVVTSAPGKTDFNAIDAAPFVDTDGRIYLFWGSYWSGIKAARMDPDTGKLAGTAPTIIPIAARAPGVHPPAIEGAYVIRRHNSYYLFVSWDFCCAGLASTYKVMVGRASSVLGPYVDFHDRPLREGGGTLVLANHGRWRGPGHNSVVHAFGRDWLVHHTFDTDHPRRGRILQIRPIRWMDGWPVTGEPLTGPATASTETPPAALAGRWLHSVDFGEPRAIEILTDGHINTADGAARWRLADGVLRLEWPAKAAPGGAWVDRVVPAPDGRSYVGRNQHGNVIRGVRAEKLAQ